MFLKSAGEKVVRGPPEEKEAAEYRGGEKTMIESLTEAMGSEKSTSAVNGPSVESIAFVGGVLDL